MNVRIILVGTTHPGNIGAAARAMKNMGLNDLVLVGPRSFPLVGLSKLSDELREIVLEILQRSPVSDILTLSAYTPSVVETIPITLLHPLPVATT